MGGTGINPKYVLRVYKLRINAVGFPSLIEICSLAINRRIKEVLIKKYLSISIKYHFVILTAPEGNFDSTVFFMDMVWENINKWKLEKDTTVEGVQLGLDEFIVNSMMFIPDSNLFMIAVDNLGIVIIDLSRVEVVESIIFKKLFSDLSTKFEITNIIPIATSGIRVLLKNKGGFSLFWDKILKLAQKGHILENLVQKNRFINLKNQISTDFVDYSELSIVQLVYHQSSGGFYDAFIRVYTHMNHDNSKMYKEYKIGRVPD